MPLTWWSLICVQGVFGRLSPLSQSIAVRFAGRAMILCCFFFLSLHACLVSRTPLVGLVGYHLLLGSAMFESSPFLWFMHIQMTQMPSFVKPVGYPPCSWCPLLTSAGVPWMKRFRSSFECRSYQCQKTALEQ